MLPDKPHPLDSLVAAGRWRVVLFDGSPVFLCAEEALQRAATDPAAEQRLIKRMRGLLAPFVLRRLKSELAEQMVTKSHVMHEVSSSSLWNLIGST